jgi:UDP-N-acetylglucosamine 2-epimerase
MEPLSYLPFLGLVSRSRLVLTDSGGIQEETTVLGLVVSDPQAIRSAALAALNGGARRAESPKNGMAEPPRGS